MTFVMLHKQLDGSAVFIIKFHVDLRVLIQIYIRMPPITVAYPGVIDNLTNRILLSLMHGVLSNIPICQVHFWRLVHGISYNIYICHVNQPLFIQGISLKFLFSHVQLPLSAELRPESHVCIGKENRYIEKKQYYMYLKQLNCCSKSQKMI